MFDDLLSRPMQKLTLHKEKVRYPPGHPKVIVAVCVERCAFLAFNEGLMKALLGKVSFGGNTVSARNPF